MKKIIFFIGIVLLATSANSEDAKELIEENNCMSCHNKIGPKNAPSFAGIARRNIRLHGFENAKIKIKNSIANGSRGKYMRFSNTNMPPYINLTEEDLDKIAEYILSFEDIFYKGGKR